MGIPITPLSLEKNPDAYDPFANNRNNDNEGHIFDSSQSSTVHFLLDRLLRVERLFHTDRHFDGVFLDVPSMGEMEGRLSWSRWEEEDDDGGFSVSIPSFHHYLHRDIHPRPVTNSDTSSGLCDIWKYFPAFFPDKPKPARTRRARRAGEENIVAEPIRVVTKLLCHEFHVYYLKHPRLLAMQNESHSDHKKLSQCVPSHFWQVLH